MEKPRFTGSTYRLKSWTANGTAFAACTRNSLFASGRGTNIGNTFILKIILKCFYYTKKMVFNSTKLNRDKRCRLAAIRPSVFVRGHGPYFGRNKKLPKLIRQIRRSGPAKGHPRLRRFFFFFFLPKKRRNNFRKFIRTNAKNLARENMTNDSLPLAQISIFGRILDFVLTRRTICRHFLVDRPKDSK